MDKREALEKATRYIREARRVIQYDRAVLFGSYLRDNVREDSDIDVGLFVDLLDERIDYLDLLSSLYLLAQEVDVHIEPHLFIRSEDRSGFAAEVEREGVRLVG